MAAKAKRAILAIHGVGAPAVGDIVKELSRQCPEIYYRRHDLVEGGTTFARLTSNGEVPDLVEVNWSDIKRPPRSIMGIAEWIVALSFAVSRARQRGATDMLYVQRFHAIFLETVLLWVLFPVLLGLMHANLDAYYLAIADAAIIGLAVLTSLTTRKTTKVAQASGYIALAVIGILVAIMTLRPELTEKVNPVVVEIYGWTQIVAAGFITLTAIELGIRLTSKKGPSVAQALAHLAFAYLPLAMLSALGSVIWAVALNLLRLKHSAAVSSTPEWEKMFVQHLGYNLKYVEWAMAGVTALLGLFVIAATIAYRLTNNERQGSVAHKSIFWILVLTPSLLALPGALLALTSPHFGPIWRTSFDTDVVKVYVWSALRILPWLAAIVAPVAILLDVLADVVFYITDERLALSSFKVCNERLSKLFDYSKRTYESVEVIAHSQGSVIAYNVLPADQKLITVGSPLGTLYQEYLGLSIASRPAWQNLYRSGDYIGGMVGISKVDVNIGPGGHTSYWSDPRLQPWLR
jgi:hypothetical protein